MEMADLKIKREEPKATAIAEAAMDYPYGTKLYLEEDAIEKLEMEKLPSPGSAVKGQFVAVVESASIHKGPDGTKRSLCLQITKLGIGGGEKMSSEEGTKKPKMIPNKPEVDGPSADKVLYAD